MNNQPDSYTGITDGAVITTYLVILAVPALLFIAGAWVWSMWTP